VAQEVSQLLQVVFRSWRSSGQLELEAVEMAVRSSMHRAGAAALSRLLSMPTDVAEPVHCACGQQARYHDTRPKQLLTVLGPLEIERAYYHCAPCRQGHSPRDRELDVEGTECSAGVRRMLAVAGSESSFEQGQARRTGRAGRQGCRTTGADPRGQAGLRV
jgi:hypothetical protein